MTTPHHNNDRTLLTSKITATTHLTSLYHALDQQIYLQIAVLYYQDNSFLNLFLRWIGTTNFVPATAAALHRVPVVLLLNLVCILHHVFGASPTPATSSSRGFMDGSVLVDFVGEFAHTSRVKLVGQDLLLLGLQVLMMVVGNVRQRATEGAKEPVAQDLDAEEQGVRRRTTATNEVREGEDGDGDGDDVEMQTLMPGTTARAEMAVPTVIELDVMHEIRDIIRNNTELYNRVRAGNEEALRAVLQAVATGRARPTTTTTTTTTATVPTASAEPVPP